MCEYGTTLAYNKPDEIEWTVYSASNGTETGVTMSVANGQDCQPSTDAPAQPRNISVHFVCDMGQEGKLTTVSRPSKCATGGRRPHSVRVCQCERHGRQWRIVQQQQEADGRHSGECSKRAGNRRTGRTVRSDVSTMAGGSGCVGEDEHQQAARYGHG